MKNLRIAFDVMGGDIGPVATVPAALNRLAQYSNLHIVLVGDQAAIQAQLQKHSALSQGVAGRWSIQHAPDVVAMDEPPAHALRKKRHSSMRLAIDLVHTGDADACVSAGNTGALMATARFVLKTIPGIDRPAIASSLPTRKGQCLMLDLGANLDCSAEHLVQFAVMGSLLASAAYGVHNPRVALLNVGVEQIKGREEVKAAAHYLQAIKEINYAGFIEGDGIYAGEADVVVCDGFAGNVALKSSEGIAKLVFHVIKQKINASWFNRLLALLARPMLRALANDMDPKRYNGASLLGLRGIVVKSHGGADEFALRYAIDQCVREVKNNVPQLIAEQVSTIVEEMRTIV